MTRMYGLRGRAQTSGLQKTHTHTHTHTHTQNKTPHQPTNQKPHNKNSGTLIPCR
jgi:hypothetical protein